MTEKGTGLADPPERGLFTWADDLARARPHWRAVTASLAFVAAYVAAAAGAFLLDADPVAPVWPAAAVSYAAVLLGGWRIWPLITTADILANVVSGLPALPLQVVGNTLGPLFGAWLVLRWRPGVDLALVRVQDVAAVLVAGGLGGAILSAMLGTAALVAHGTVGIDRFADITLAWILGDQLGIVAFTPIVLTAMLRAGGRITGPGASPGGPYEAGVAGVLATLLLAGLLWATPDALVPALTLFLSAFGLAIWIALRCPLWQTYAWVALMTLGATATGMELIREFPDVAFGLRWGVLVPYVGILSITATVVAAGRSERAEYAKDLLYRSSHDPLTGLLNRDAFETGVRNAMISGQSSALCYIDLDQFKIVNDTFGHGVGDQLLRELADHLREGTNDDIEIARLGGDEFGVLLRGGAAMDVRRSADRIRRRIEDFRFAYRGRMHTISASIGVVLLHEMPGRDFNAVLSAADATCFAAKDLGRNRIYVFSPEDPDMAKRLDEMAWTGFVSRALDEDRFELSCQSIVSLQGDDGKGHGVEFLTRMIGDEGERIPPSLFIPVAEQYDIMPRLDRWITRAIFRWMKQHPAEVEGIGFFSVNLSGASLTSRAFQRYMLGVLQRLDLPLKKLCFEVTETAAIGNLELARSFMEELRGIGCCVALDDFGSGLSSFGYLRNLPVDFLKIDGQFVRDMTHDRLSESIVRSINDLGHLIGIRTIAEHAEDAATVDRLRALGVDYAQGHFFDEAVDVSEYFSRLPRR